MVGGRFGVGDQHQRGDGGHARRRWLVGVRPKVWTGGPDGLRDVDVQPGVDVRPLRQMSGGYHINEVFLDKAFVPEPGLIGTVGGGWAVLCTMLASERAAIGGGTSARAASHLVALASARGLSGDRVARQTLAAAVTRERLLDLLQARVGAGQGVPAAGSVAKLLL